MEHLMEGKLTLQSLQIITWKFEFIFHFKYPRKTFTVYYGNSTKPSAELDWELTQYLTNLSEALRGLHATLDLNFVYCDLNGFEYRVG